MQQGMGMSQQVRQIPLCRSESARQGASRDANGICIDYRGDS